MKRYGFWIFVALLAVITGCVEQKSDVYYVMFEDNPLLISDKVYSGGEEIGKIESRVIGFDNITEVTISLQSAHEEKIGENAVFYISAGRLEHDMMSPAGLPLDPGSAVPGFSSNLSLKWGRVKGAFSRTNAKKRAELLRTKIRWIEPVEAPI
ncbi:MAG: hypothetical protein GY859_19130 [Desulfobacterales bacterium]|nr:hypothetical protein [Desulfobacterales bacterium]